MRNLLPLLLCFVSLQLSAQTKPVQPDSLTIYKQKALLLQKENDALREKLFATEQKRLRAEYKLNEIKNITIKP